MSIYLPNFNDQRIIDFCGSNGVSVDGFYKALGDLGFTGSIDDRWKAYLTDKYGYFAGLHVGNYESEALFEFLSLVDPEIPSAGTPSTTTVNLGASGAAAHANWLRYSIYTDELAAANLEYPASTASFEGYQPFNANVAQRYIGPGTATGAADYDNLWFVRFESTPTISSTLSQAKINFSIFNVASDEGVFTPIRIRAIKTAPTWPTGLTNGVFVSQTVPIGYGNYTSTYVDWAPDFWADDYGSWITATPTAYSVDVTEIVRELIGTAGGAGTTIFVFETIETLGAQTSRFRITSAGTTMPTFTVITGNDERKAQLKTPTNARTLYYVPFDRLDVTDSVSTFATWRVVTGGTEYRWPTSRLGVGSSVMKASDYGALTSIQPELTELDARKAIAPINATLGEYYLSFSPDLYDFMTVYQTKQSGAGELASWLFDNTGNTGFVTKTNELDSSTLGFSTSSKHGNGDVATKWAGGSEVQTHAAPYNDTVGAVKTLVTIWDVSDNKWHYGYHNGDQWYWFSKSKGSTDAAVAQTAVSGVTSTTNIMQGLACVEFTTARTVAEYKQLAHDMRVLWSNNFKGLPEDL